MAKMPSETRLNLSRSAGVFLMIAVAVGAFWMGLSEAQACQYSYSGNYHWYDGTMCWASTDCDDVGGFYCWIETCYKKCVDGQKSGGYKHHSYGCDDNCNNPLMQQCVTCD